MWIEFGSFQQVRILGVARFGKLRVKFGIQRVKFGNGAEVG